MFAREESQNEELNGLETALRSLKPAPASVDRHRLMYLAGQASMQPTIRPFIYRSIRPMTIAASVMLAALLGRVTAPEHVQVVDRVVQIPAQIDHEQLKEEQQFAEVLRSREMSSHDAPNSAIALHSADLPFDRELLRPYVRLRDQVVALGPDMLPALGGSDRARAVAPNSYGQMRQDLVQ